MSVRLVAVSGGNCATFNGTVVQNRSPNNSKEQLWTIEKEKQGSDNISIRNNANGQYLRAKTGNAYQQLELSRMAQWWKLEPGKARGSYFVRCTDFKDAYLCNCKGLALADPNQIYIWPRTGQEKIWVHAITWYLQDAETGEFVAGGRKSEAGTKAEEVKKREQELADTKKELARRLAELEQKQKDLDAKLQAGPDIEDTKMREQAIAEKEKDLARRSAEMEQMQKDLDAKLRAAKDKADSLAERERSVGIRERSADSLSAEDKTERDEELRKWAKELGEREAKLQERERQPVRKQVSGSSRENATSQTETNPTNISDADLEAENNRLKAEIEAMKKRTMFSPKSWDPDGQVASKLQLGDRAGNNGMAPPIKKPGQHLPKDWNPELLRRWEIGKQAIVSRTR